MNRIRTWGSPAWGAVSMLMILNLAGSARAQEGAPALRLSWTNNILTINAPDLPGERVEIWYLEAFCRGGSTHRDWNQTTIPHRTELVESEAGRRLVLRTLVEPAVEVKHVIEAGDEEVRFELTLTNRGDQPSEIQWFQPCLRVDRFTGRKQEDYWERCFIFTKAGLRTLDQTHRTEEAIYRGGQVYVPAGIDLNDVNPRPLSPDRPINGLIGCFSADNKKILAMAWDKTQELFQGVIVCIHNDPRVGGLAPGEVKRLQGRVYLMDNNPRRLLRRYEEDLKGR